MDHWEGLKDADWFWRRDNGLHLELLAPDEALAAIERAYDHPSYVPLERLAMGNLASFSVSPVEIGRARSFGDWKIEAFRLNHYSGGGDHKHFLSTAGYRFELSDGPAVAYLSDHEPTSETASIEAAMGRGAHLLVYDSSFPEIKNHAYGHGSLEYSSIVARAHPELLVLATHHGPNSTDPLIRETYRRFGKELPNLRLAVEGEAWVWDAVRAKFVRKTRLTALAPARSARPAPRSSRPIAVAARRR